tara:strand:- start:2696 stop:2869 length:174 start_codon:yes stop_codon:yes gene_type:complete
VKTKDVEWEIEQVWMAIEYFEKAIQNAWSVSEIYQYEQSIHALRASLRKLEDERDRD